MVCVNVVSTPVKANLNSQYVSSQQIFDFKCQEIQSEPRTQAGACVKYVLLYVLYSVTNNLVIDHLQSCAQCIHMDFLLMMLFQMLTVQIQLLFSLKDSVCL